MMERQPPGELGTLVRNHTVCRLSMEAKRSQASKLIGEAKHLVTAISTPMDAFDVTTEDILTVSLVAHAVVIVYKLQLFLLQPGNTPSDVSDVSDLFASIDEEIDRICKKHSELLLEATPAEDDEEQNQQDKIESRKRLHELLDYDYREENDHNQDDNSMEQLLKKKKKHKKNKK